MSWISDLKSTVERKIFGNLQGTFNTISGDLEAYMLKEHNKNVHIEIKGDSLENMSVDVTGDIENKEEMIEFIKEKISEYFKKKI